MKSAFILQPSDVSLDFAHDSLQQGRGRLSVIRIAGGEGKQQSVAAAIHDPVELEPVKPAR
jgi:hypothetical protein